MQINKNINQKDVINNAISLILNGNFPFRKSSLPLAIFYL